MRPLSYFILIAILVGILTLETILLPLDRKYTVIILIKYCILFLFLRWTPQVLFQDVGGFDPYWHKWFTDSIVQVGYIPIDEAYSLLPSLHLLVGSVMLLINSDYKTSSILAVSLLQTASYIFVYLLGNQIYNRKIGLLLYFTWRC